VIADHDPQKGGQLMSFRARSTFRSVPRPSPRRLDLPDEPPSALLRLYAALAATAVIGFSVGLCYLALEILRWAGLLWGRP